MHSIHTPYSNTHTYTLAHTRSKYYGRTSSLGWLWRRIQSMFRVAHKFQKCHASSKSNARRSKGKVWEGKPKGKPKSNRSQNIKKLVSGNRDAYRKIN